MQDLCHDDAVCEAHIKDPLIKLQGSLRGLSDMLNGVGVSLALASGVPTIFREQHS